MGKIKLPSFDEWVITTFATHIDSNGYLHIWNSSLSPSQLNKSGIIMIKFGSKSGLKEGEKLTLKLIIQVILADMTLDYGVGSVTISGNRYDASVDNEKLVLEKEVHYNSEDDFYYIALNLQIVNSLDYDKKENQKYVVPSILIIKKAEATGKKKGGPGGGGGGKGKPSIVADNHFNYIPGEMS